MDRAPVLDPPRGRVGPLGLGDGLEAARPIGRPERLRDATKGRQVLDYGWFDLEFKDGRLECVRFDIDDGTKVVVAGDIVLSRATKPLDAFAWFGDPASDSGEAQGLRWLDFTVAGDATLALEFDEEGLTCVQLYAAGYA